mmetsp:Transcript_31290/g.71584  ORF Transcript_31290/g.71584 Transcript_31290/m.71584 type:complete len:229 (-) Transcript_31290:2984-3670(-)
MSSNIAIIVPPITSVLSTADVASRNATLPSLPVAPVAKTLPVIAERNQTPVFGCTAPVVAPVPTVTMATVAKATPRTSSTSSGARTGSGSQNENTGRWTAEEHRLFLKGLEEHGKGWKKIASLIKSRTVVQIRTHAQKYFQKLAKARQNGEEGEVTMEGRNAFPHSKKRRQSNGNFYNFHNLILRLLILFCSDFLLIECFFDRFKKERSNIYCAIHNEGKQFIGSKKD